MIDAICEKNFICDAFINNKTKVVILEDMPEIRAEIQEFIEKELEWQVIIAESRDQIVELCQNQSAEFYILDIKLGNEPHRCQEGIDAAEVIKEIDKNVFVSIFSGILDSHSYRKSVKNVGVNYFEEKGNVVREGVARIAIEMLRFKRDLVDNIFQTYLSSSASFGNDEVLKIVHKIKEVNTKLKDIQELEKSYQCDSTDHPSDNPTLDPKLLPIEEDENIRAYKSWKQNSESQKWREQNQNRYVAFADGTWLKDVVADTLKDLLDKLRNSEHKGKSIFYKKVPKNNIVGTQESDKLTRKEKVYESSMSSHDFFLSEDKI